MDLDGGESEFSTNTAGAKYGTGYCDSQCPSDVKFIDGVVSMNPFKANFPIYVLICDSIGQLG